MTIRSLCGKSIRGAWGSGFHQGTVVNFTRLVDRVVSFGSAVADLDDAFVALGGSGAGGGDADCEVVGVVEEGLAGFEGEGRLVVDQGH